MGDDREEFQGRELFKVMKVILKKVGDRGERDVMQKGQGQFQVIIREVGYYVNCYIRKVGVESRVYFRVREFLLIFYYWLFV